jgi:glycosyltransferase involved in cell wall biosynthesis
MAHGLPAVASDVGGVASLLGDGAGVVVPPGDVAALADALRGLLADPDRRAAMGARALAVARERYGIERMRDATLAVFADLAGRRR